jgi:hypothetical protein
MAFKHSAESPPGDRARGVKVNLTGELKERRTQLHFFDDGSFKFRVLPLKDSCIAQETDGKVLKAWPHFYAGEIQFDGHKGIQGDMVTLSFDRDMILDPFERVPISESTSGKPRKDDVSVKKWLAQIAESQRYKVMSKPSSMMLIDKITLFLGSGFILMVLGFVISKVSG